jgi:Ca2+-binding RTX toxin-like protein
MFGQFASCPADGVTQIRLTLGDRDDEVEEITSLSGPFPDVDVLIEAGPGDDMVQGGETGERVFGGEGNDTLNVATGSTASAGDDQVNGEAGDDALGGGVGSDRLDGGDGNDTLTGGSNEDTLFGGSGVDQLSGDGGDDSIDGGDGDDTFSGGSSSNGRDTISGSAGRDLIDYSSRDTPIAVSLDNASDDGGSGEGDNVRSDVEDLIGGSAADRVTASAAVNQIDGRGGDDFIDGGEGDDVLAGGDATPGNDTLMGGGGNDMLRSGPGDDSVVGQAGNDVGDGGGGADTVNGSEGADNVMGGAGIDAVSGDEGNDQVQGAAPELVGSDGADDLDGGAGVDGLSGGPGNDNLDGGAGADALSGGQGTDTADYAARTVPLTVSLDASANDGVAGENDNVAADTENIAGGTAADTLTGDTSANDLRGGAGEDYIDGGSGGDRVSGGDSSDVLRTRNGAADQVSCGGRSADFVIADVNDQIDPDCDETRVDDGAGQKPVAGKAAVVTPASGTVAMSPAGIKRSVPLKDKLVLPTKSLIDARGGRVNLVGAQERGKTRSGQFRGGTFLFSEIKGRAPLTQLTLTGDAVTCPRNGRAPVLGHAAAKRQLWARGRGRFRTRGRNSAATVRGTEWYSKDTCAGTLTVVQSGTVEVRDFVKDKTVVLKRGQRYLARPKRR